MQLVDMYIIVHAYYQSGGTVRIEKTFVQVALAVLLKINPRDVKVDLMEPTLDVNLAVVCSLGSSPTNSNA